MVTAGIELHQKAPGFFAAAWAGEEGSGVYKASVFAAVVARGEVVVMEENQGGLRQLSGGGEVSVRLWLVTPHPLLDGDAPQGLARAWAQR